jgi:hypothetical protein
MMWSNKASGSGSSTPTKRANISGYLGNGGISLSRSHARLEDDEHSESLEDEFFDLHGQALQPSSARQLLKDASSSSPLIGSSSAESSDSSSLLPIHEDCEDFDASYNSTPRNNSSRKIVEMDVDTFDLDDVEESYMLSVWSNADVDVGVGGSVYSGKSYGKASFSTASTSLSSSSLSSNCTTSTRSRHRGAARRRLAREEQAYDPTSNTSRGWVASFQVAAEMNNCGDWEPQTGFFKRQPFHLPIRTPPSALSSSSSVFNDSVWQEPTPFDYCKKERIEV